MKVKSFFHIFIPSWRNWITRSTSNRKIVGSSPIGGIKILLYILLICVSWSVIYFLEYMIILYIL